MKKAISIFWFRRDLRLEDNVGLFHALQSEHPVLPIFIFDTKILEKLPRTDARVTFLYNRLQKIHKTLKTKFKSGIAQFKGKPLTVFSKLLVDFSIRSVFTNHDYEPYAVQRDTEIKTLLENHGIPFNTFKDQVIFEKEEILEKEGGACVSFSTYLKRWKEKFRLSENTKEYLSQEHLNSLHITPVIPELDLAEIGFSTSPIKVQEFDISTNLIQGYETTKDIPSITGNTTRLGPHLRFGTVSIRKIAKVASDSENLAFLNELIRREFFMQILWHFPHTQSKAFKSKYDNIDWLNNEAEFHLWKTGRTGYVLVDAGMRELNNTGYINNHQRMLTASFLSKHLLIDWRWGEAYFALKLLDYELSSNVGNWQWTCGCGMNTASYFRIVNPTLQMEELDTYGNYILKWVPEFQELSYPPKIIDHQLARERCLKVYKAAVG